MSLAALEKRVAALAVRLAAPRATMTPNDVARGAGLELDGWQRALAEDPARQIAMLCSRQAGKSTLASVMAAHQAVSVPRSLTLIVSPSLRQSGELYRKVRAVLAALGEAAPTPTEESAARLELANGSRIVSLPGTEKTVRGFSAPDLVIEDEAARVADEMFFAMRPTLAVSRGRLVLLSSAFGRRGHFYETWQYGGPGWRRVKVTAYDVPRIDPAWLEAERAAIGDWWFAQEYLCEFRDAVDAFFRGEDIDAMASADVVPLFGGRAA